jgi:hypothetical protein
MLLRSCGRPRADRMALLLPEGRRSRRPLLHAVAAPASLHYAAAALAVNLQKRHILAWY